MQVSSYCCTPSKLLRACCSQRTPGCNSHLTIHVHNHRMFLSVIWKNGWCRVPGDGRRRTLLQFHIFLRRDLAPFALRSTWRRSRCSFSAIWKPCFQSAPCGVHQKTRACNRRTARLRSHDGKGIDGPGNSPSFFLSDALHERTRCFPRFGRARMGRIVRVMLPSA